MEVNIPRCLVEFWVHLTPDGTIRNGLENDARPPFYLAIQLATSFTFEPHVARSSRPGQQQIQWRLTSSHVDRYIRVNQLKIIIDMFIQHN
jgi:hypothetical protein